MVYVVIATILVTVCIKDDISNDEINSWIEL